MVFGHQIAVGEHDPFGQPRGAAGGLDHGQGGRVHVDLRRAFRRGAQQGIEPMEVPVGPPLDGWRLGPHQNQMRQLHLGGHLGHHAQVLASVTNTWAWSPALSGHQIRCHLRRGKGHHAPGFQRAEVGDHRLGRVGQHQGHPISRLQPRPSMALAQRLTALFNWA